MSPPSSCLTIRLAAMTHQCRSDKLNMLSLLTTKLPLRLSEDEGVGADLGAVAGMDLPVHLDHPGVVAEAPKSPPLIDEKTSPRDSRF